MPEIFGLNLKPADLQARVGRMDQVAGARPFVFDDGPARGMRGIDVWTGSGLEFTVLPDRCLDIGACRFAGRALAWQSSTGDVRPERYDPHGFGWLRMFHGGLVTTCGLRHFGAPDSDGGESWGLHGRASSLAAEDVAVHRAWQGGRYLLSIRGRVREAEVFKSTVVLERTISTELGSREIRIVDRVTNAGHATSTAMLLYHINLGWPLLSPESRLLVAYSAIKPVTDHAATGLRQHCRMQQPTRGYGEMVYTMEPRADRRGLCRAALVNPGLDGGTALSVEWPKAALPYLMQWKMMGQGTYVLGVEPANCPFPPRAELRKSGKMPSLAPGEAIRVSLVLRVHCGRAELRALEKAVGAARR
ncbi:MAG: DUF4432 family protein [Planctomycetes bacterium]|nr:DUF4432 family protein [Planctomycetota bacterium]